MSDDSIVSYPYDRGALLSKPHTYFFSAYSGKPFLHAWIAARERHTADVEMQPPVIDPVSSYPTDNGETDTQYLLDQFVVALQKGDLPDMHRRKLNAILRNFEAKKRLYNAYGAGFSSRGRTDHDNLALYVRFGEVLALVYAQSSELPYLNALHKCIDILGATHSSLDAELKPRLSWIIGQERQFVFALADKLGISLP